ncbi:unnamed protein product, partial [Discosporangium mesarthrocarpum]
MKMKFTGALAHFQVFPLFALPVIFDLTQTIVGIVMARIRTLTLKNQRYFVEGGALDAVLGMRSPTSRKAAVAFLRMVAALTMTKGLGLTKERAPPIDIFAHRAVDGG